MKKVRWGISGPGIIAHRFADAVKNVDCAELTAVASRDIGRADDFAKKHGIPNVFCGYQNMANFDGVDAVYVATPHSHHMPVAEIFLNAGKHVLCEKPICANAREAQRLKDAAEKNGVFLMEAMWTRFLPAMLEAVSIVKSGEIGEVRSVHADFCANFPYLEGHRIHTPALAGGALLDIGVYCMHFAAIFLGCEPESVIASGETANGVDVNTGILMKYKNGAVANITTALSVSKPATAYIYGSKGRITIPDFYYATRFTVNTDDGERTVEKDCLGNGFEEEVIECCECIANGKTQSDTMPIDESIAILAQMDSVREQIGVRFPFEDMI